MRAFFSIGILAAMVAGCDSTEPGPRLPEELAGTWRAEAACAECTFTLTSVANPEQSFDLLDPPSSVTAVLTLTRSGSATLDLMGSHVSGMARVSGSQLILTALASADTMDYAVTGSNLTLDFHGTFELVDFTGDGLADPATGHAVLRKQ
ncbi:MAG TPA: hypothetical protein VF035_09610 [Longimicrobiales bacterium]